MCIYMYIYIYIYIYRRTRRDAPRLVLTRLPTPQETSPCQDEDTFVNTAVWIVRK